MVFGRRSTSGRVPACRRLLFFQYSPESSQSRVLATALVSRRAGCDPHVSIRSGALVHGGMRLCFESSAASFYPGRLRKYLRMAGSDLAPWSLRTCHHHLRQCSRSILVAFQKKETNLLVVAIEPR